MNRQFIIDEEISLSAGNDILKTKIYSDNLKKIILNTPSNKAFTIGLFGSWGAGKSSIIKTTKEDIEKDNPKIKFITYDAWKYVNDSFRRMFLLNVQQELRYEQTEEMQRFYQSVTAEAEPKTYISTSGVTLSLMACLVVIILFGVIPISIEWKMPLYSIFTLIGLIITIYSGIFPKLKIQINKPMIFAPEQFEVCFREMIESSFKKDNLKTRLLKFIKLTQNPLTGLEKIVIVIDNIDRCHNTMAYQLLTDIKTFLSNEALNVVFIIPVDDEALKQNLFASNKSTDECDKEKEEFLRKFFNIAVRIKPHQPTELLSFAQELNTKYELGYNDETIALCSKEFATNPRRIIQLFNNLASELCLYPDEFAQANETIICAILILREEYAAYYTAIVNNVYNLVNFETNKTKDKDLDAPFVSFMRIAAPIFRNVSKDVLLRILNNSDAVFSDIPQEIKFAITTYDAKPVIEYIANDQRQENNIFDYIIKNTQENIKSKSDLQIINSIEFVGSLIEEIDLPVYFLRIFDGDCGDKYEKLLKGINKSTSVNLCKLASKLETIELKTLKNSIFQYIKNIDLENKADKERLFVESVFTIFKSRKDCEDLRDFTTKLFKVTNIYTNVKYSTDQINWLFSDELIEFYISQITIGENSETENLLWLLEKKTNIQAEYYSSLFEKISNLVGNTTNKSKEQILSFIKYTLSFIKLIDSKQLDNNNTLQALNEKLEKRNVSGYTKQIFDEYQNSPEELNLLTDYVIQVYRISNTVKDSLVHKSISYNKDYTYSKLIELTKDGYSLLPFIKPIMNDIDYNSDALIKLLNYYLLLDDVNINDNDLKNKVISLLDNIANQKVQKLIEDISGNDRMKQSIVEDIVTRDSTYINQLPQPLLKLAVSSFTTETAKNYVDNMGFLSIIASKGTQEQKDELVKILVGKINQGEDLRAVFNILQEIKLSKSYNKNMIHGALESYKENSGAKDEQVDNLIAKFKD